MLSLRRHPLRDIPTCLRTLSVFFFTPLLLPLSLPLLLFPKQLLLLSELTCYDPHLLPLISRLFPPFIMACLGVVLVLFSDLAVFLWCWRLLVSEGAKITVLIFTFEDFAFLIGEEFNFAGVCFGIFFVLLCAALTSKWELFFLSFKPNISDRAGFALNCQIVFRSFNTLDLSSELSSNTYQAACRN